MPCSGILGWKRILLALFLFKDSLWRRKLCERKNCACLTVTLLYGALPGLYWMPLCDLNRIMLPIRGMVGINSKSLHSSTGCPQDAASLWVYGKLYQAKLACLSARNLH